MGLCVGVLGVNFKTASLACREAVAQSALRLSGMKSLFFPYPTVLLSTCNRTEIYFAAEDLAQAQIDLISFLREKMEIPFEPFLYSYFGSDCLSHLIQVAAGLDSAILAETDVQRQVKLAYAQGTNYQRLPSSLHYLFQKGLQAAKALRQLSSQGPSLYAELFRIAKDHWKDLNTKKVLLVGYSEAHRGLASFFRHKEMKSIVFCSRSPEKVVGYRAMQRGEIHFQEYDLISFATKGDFFSSDILGAAGQLIFDLSFPRVVDPKVAEQGAFLMHIEEITQRMHQSQREMKNLFEIEAILMQKAHSLIGQYLLKQRKSTKRFHSIG